MSDLMATRLTWFGLIVMMVGLFAINEACYRVAARRYVIARDARKSQIDLIVASLLGLLGLLLAFSFDIGEDQFTKRRDLVLAEANAIGTTYLRADMLPEPSAGRIHDLLRRYVDERSDIRSPDDLDRALVRSAELHTQLWHEATEVARANLGSPVVALFVASLNEVIDLHESRLTVGLFQRMPPVIIGTLYFVALLCVGMVGLRAGIDRTRSAGPTIALVIVIMAVLALIDSLDTPGSKLFKVSKRALADTKALIEKDRAAPASAMQ